ncbi:MAG: bifunctional hydroxymethylpyrimidine kinase/phosphomethylpyrimidine kinase [Bradymonadaceae bacterium]|nr:bifunctional hydroxymethylpyrimidine kinase/phosphomethylpyrimidine kinase [Lujinxingiaceae bacterium]
MSPKCLLTIAGTDPSGGAGIQADLQVFRDFGYHGLSAITAVVWQNTCGVGGFEAMSGEVLGEQLRALAEDVAIEGVKLGMLPAVTTVEAVCAFLANCAHVPVVLDPVMASGDGGHLLSANEAVLSAAGLLHPFVAVLTPNVPEAERLLGRTIQTHDAMLEAAASLRQFGAKAVLLKGGHLVGQADFVLTDAWADADGARLLEALLPIEQDVRGTGCQLASAILAGLVDGLAPMEAALGARRYLNDLLHRRRANIGRGRPVIVRSTAGGILPEENE